MNQTATPPHRLPEQRRDDDEPAWPCPEPSAMASAQRRRWWRQRHQGQEAKAS